MTILEAEKALVETGLPARVVDTARRHLWLLYAIGVKEIYGLHSTDGRGVSVSWAHHGCRYVLIVELGAFN